MQQNYFILGAFLALSLLFLVQSQTSHQAVNRSSQCGELSQKAMQTQYIKSFIAEQFNMSINVEMDYEAFMHKVNEFFSPSEFNEAFTVIAQENCSEDVLQPNGKYWEYHCDYNPRRIPQNRWYVQCHTAYNPCRNKTVHCSCNGQDTGDCSDGIYRRLECSCQNQTQCSVPYVIAQDWEEVRRNVMYMELDESQRLELNTCGLVSPMETYLSSKWKLKQERVAVACTCVEQRPKPTELHL